MTQKAELAEDVQVGPFAIIGPDVKIGGGTVVGPHAILKGPTTVGMRNRIFQFASVGEDCQDKKYKGERTELVIGDDNIIREGCDVASWNLQDRGVTHIGSNNLFMCYVHVAHDCVSG